MFQAMLAWVMGLGMLIPQELRAIDCNAFKVWSFNIRFSGGTVFCASDCTNEWYKGELAQGRREVAKMYMQKYKPDLFGLQEVRNPVPFIPLVSSQLLDVAGWFSDHQYYAVDRGDGEHCAIFYRKSRFTRLDAGTFWLSCTPDVQSKHPLDTDHFRITSWVKLRDEAMGSTFYVFNTHMSLEESVQQYSAALIRERIHQIAQGMPVILMGDFNSYETQAPVQIVQGQRRYIEPGACTRQPAFLPPSSLDLINSFRRVVPNPIGEERTSHGFRGGVEGERIDHVFHTSGILEPFNAVIRRDSFEGDCGPAGCLPSDHYALELDFHTLLPEVFVDMDWPEGACEMGSRSFPYNTVLEGVTSVKSGGTLFLNGGSTPAGMVIHPPHPLTLTSLNGVSILGK